jgi:hypothetical protein
MYFSTKAFEDRYLDAFGWYKLVDIDLFGTNCQTELTCILIFSFSAPTSLLDRHVIFIQPTPVKNLLPRVIAS